MPKKRRKLLAGFREGAVRLVRETSYRVPHTLTCLLLGVSLAWFYKWQRWTRRCGTCSRTRRGCMGRPAARRSARGCWQVSEKTVAESMRRQGLIAES
jgi:putative transposase